MITVEQVIENEDRIRKIIEIFGRGGFQQIAGAVIITLHMTDEEFNKYYDEKNDDVVAPPLLVLRSTWSSNGDE